MSENIDRSLAQILVSADSHVTERPSVWNGVLDPKFFDGRGSLTQTRGVDPQERASEMRRDGVVAEVLYPTLGLSIFAINDPEVHEEACRAYNRWLGEFIAVDRERLLGVALLPCYRADVAVAELRAAHAAGLRGAMVWQSPHPDLPFTSFHYDPIWKVAEELNMPITLHILTGFPYGEMRRAALDPDRAKMLYTHHTAVNEKLSRTTDALFSFVDGGVLDRFPGLRLVLVENEVGWLPFFMDQWDYYAKRWNDRAPLGLPKLPSQYIGEQVYATFFRDPFVGDLLNSWGHSNLMWSNDFPHGNSTWPHSQEYVAKELGHLDVRTQDQVLRENCVNLYRIAPDVLLTAS